MQLHPYRPQPPLSPYVELIWLVRGSPDYAREKVLPNGVVELIFNLGEPHKVVDPSDPERFELHRDAWVAGLHESFLLIEAVDGFDLVGVRLHPLGAYRLFGVPMTEITNRVVDAELIVDPAFNELRERLWETRSPVERVALVEAFLTRRLAAGAEVEPWIEAVAGRLTHIEEPLTITALSRWVGFSHKHLVARCRQRLGTTPKLLRRIYRFQAVIERARGRAAVDWADLALDCGYYDQAHLIRDFRLFAGATPGHYLQWRDDDENHLIVEGSDASGPGAPPTPRPVG